MGLPRFVGRAKYSIFARIKVRFWKKLQGEKDKLLSRVGKEVLLKAVAQAKPTNSNDLFYFAKDFM